MKYKKITEHIYRNDIVFFLMCKTDKPIKDKLKKEFPKVYEEIKDIDLIEHSGGKCLLYPDDGFIGIITRKRGNIENDVSSLAHECLHAVMSILNNRGVEYGTDTYSHNEAFTYLLENLMFEGVGLLKLK